MTTTGRAFMIDPFSPSPSVSSDPVVVVVVLLVLLEEFAQELLDHEHPVIEAQVVLVQAEQLVAEQVA